MNGLSNKTVVITGALGGIAKATIQALDQYQMNFILIDIVAEDQSFIQSLNSQVHYFQTDISISENVNELKTKITALYPCVDFIIHAAGLYQHIELVDLDYAEWNR